MQRFSHVFTFVLMGALVCASLLTASVSASAQDSNPGATGSAFADLGLPELQVTVSDTGFEGIPDELEEASTPAGGEGEGQGGPPEVFYQSTFAGGTYARPGETSQVVLDLTPGEWVARADDTSAPQEPVIFTVTGEMPGNLAEPASAATITMAEYTINVSEGALTTGPQVVKITNVGAQPHFIFVARGPAEMTEQDIAAILEADMTGTPAATDLDPDADFVDVLGAGTQSTNTDIWVSLDLEPGKYVMVCFFPDIESGLPHALEGMYSVIEVGE